MIENIKLQDYYMRGRKKKEIIKILELSEHDYDAIIQELRLDFQEYIHVEDKKQT